MADAPERIWATPSRDMGWQIGQCVNWQSTAKDTVEFVRADLYEQVKRERDESACHWREAFERMHQRAMTAERFAEMAAIERELGRAICKREWTENGVRMMERIPSPPKSPKPPPKPALPPRQMFKEVRHET